MEARGHAKLDMVRSSEKHALRNSKKWFCVAFLHVPLRNRRHIA